MKPIRFAAVFAAGLAAFTGGALAEVGVSVSIGQPGFYGRIDIGNYPPPLLIYPQPLVIERVRPGVSYAPIYLHVPPGHAKKWHKHCHRYQACGRPAYFVQDRWYNDVYVPRYRERREHRHDERGRGNRRDRDERGYAPDYPPGPRPVFAPGGGADYPPGARPGYGPGPGFGHGHGHGRP